MSKTKRLTTDAVLVALYTVLTVFVSIKAGNLRISIASLPIVVCALLYGPADACMVAALGELMNQMLSYGFTVTTPLWLIPPALRGLIIGLAAMSAWKRGGQLEKKLWRYYLVCLAAALATTLTNTGVIWLDSVLLGYYNAAYVFGDFTVRVITSVVTVAVVSTAAIPVAMALRRAGFGAPKAVPAVNG